LQHFTAQQMLYLKNYLEHSPVMHEDLNKLDGRDPGELKANRSKYRGKRKRKKEREKNIVQCLIS